MLLRVSSFSRLNSIPLYGWIMVCLSFHPSVDAGAASKPAINSVLSLSLLGA